MLVWTVKFNKSSWLILARRRWLLFFSQYLDFVVIRVANLSNWFLQDMLESKKLLQLLCYQMGGWGLVIFATRIVSFLLWMDWKIWSNIRDVRYPKLLKFFFLLCWVGLLIFAFPFPLLHWQVAPAELEHLLLSHPEMVDAAVIP